MLVAKLHLHEGHVVALGFDEVSGIGAAERVQVQARREAELVQKLMKSLKEVRLADERSRRRGEYIADRLWS